jgi:hypothetical protein
MNAIQPNATNQNTAAPTVLPKATLQTLKALLVEHPDGVHTAGNDRTSNESLMMGKDSKGKPMIVLTSSPTNHQNNGVSSTFQLGTNGKITIYANQNSASPTTFFLNPETGAPVSLDGEPLANQYEYNPSTSVLQVLPDADRPTAIDAVKKNIQKSAVTKALGIAEEVIAGEKAGIPPLPPLEGRPGALGSTFKISF